MLSLRLMGGRLLSRREGVGEREREEEEEDEEEALMTSSERGEADGGRPVRGICE